MRFDEINKEKISNLFNGSSSSSVNRSNRKKIKIGLKGKYYSAKKGFDFSYKIRTDSFLSLLKKDFKNWKIKVNDYSGRNRDNYSKLTKTMFNRIKSNISDYRYKVSVNPQNKVVSLYSSGLSSFEFKNKNLRIK